MGPDSSLGVHVSSTQKHGHDASCPDHWYFSSSFHHLRLYQIVFLLRCSDSVLGSEYWWNWLDSKSHWSGPFTYLASLHGSFQFNNHSNPSDEPSGSLIPGVRCYHEHPESAVHYYGSYCCLRACRYVLYSYDWWSVVYYFFYSNRMLCSTGQYHHFTDWPRI